MPQGKRQPPADAFRGPAGWCDMRNRVRLGQLAVFLLFAAVWEAVGRFGPNGSTLLPPLSVVVRTLWTLFGDPKFRNDVMVTAFEVGTAFLCVAPFSVAAGFFLAETPAAARLVNPYLSALLATPKSLFLPVFILAFGIGFAQKVTFGATLAFFVITITSQAAVRSIPLGFITLARSMGATRAQIYRHIYLPAMAPGIIGGLRLGFIFVVIGVLSAEMYSASAGLGRAIAYWGEYFQMPKLLAAVLLVVMLSIGANTALSALERSAGASQTRFLGATS